MLKNSFQIALRKLRQHPLLSMLKIGGLGVSTCSILLMVLYVNYQWQFDRFHQNGDQIYRVQTDQYKDGVMSISSALTYPGIGPFMKVTYAGVKSQTRIGRWIGNDVVIQYKDRSVREHHFYFVEPSIFTLFSFELLRGDIHTALSEPNSVVITEKVAKNLFGETDPIGQEVTMESRKPLNVTGVIKSPPLQSHFDFEILASYSTLEAFGFDEESVYGFNNYDALYTYTYVLLDASVQPKILSAQLTEAIPDRKKVGSIKDVFHLQPLQKIYLYSDLQYEMQVTGNGTNIWILWGISMLLLALALANYFNLSTAGALDYTKAIGIRKVIGASRWQIIRQLCIENLIYTTFGLAIGIVAAVLLIPVVEFLFTVQLSGSWVLGSSYFNPIFISMVIIITGTMGSALLPAMLISSLPPIQMFKNTFDISHLGLNVRKSLVLIQFIIIVCLLAGSMAILKQTQYMQHQDPGIALSNTMIVKGPLGTSSYENLNPAHLKFRNDLNSMSSVSKVAMSHQIPGNDFEIVNGAHLEGSDEDLTFGRMAVTQSYFQLYGLQFLAGEAPKTSNPAYRRIVINEAAMHSMGFYDPLQILDKHLLFWGNNYLITGVIKNYHHLSFHHPVVPVVFDTIEGEGMEDGYFSIKMNQGSYTNHIPQIQKAFESAFPHTVFEYFDMNEYYHHQYQADSQFRTLNIVFTGLAFFISCLGLFGLSMIVVKKKIKEIAIRKVLGSSVKGIVTLLSMQFIRLIFLGWLIAIPITWYCLETWLQNFQYRISIPWWIFLVALCVAMGITLLTTSLSSIKTAMSNPVKSLRSE